jgi:hypothetical protein
LSTLLSQIQNVAAVAGEYPLTAKQKITPTNASHTYSIRGSRTVGNGYYTAGAGGASTFSPIYLKISRAL